MNHEWSAGSPLHAVGALVRRAVRFCRACGVVRVDVANAATRRGSSLFVRPVKGAAALELDAEPACAPDATTRTNAKDHARHEREAPRGVLGVALLERPELSRSEWRELAQVARFVHVARYQRPQSSNGLGPDPESWCGVPLWSAPFVVPGLAGDARAFAPGDAMCVACARAARRDRWTR